MKAKYNYVIPPFGVVLPVYSPSPRGRYTTKGGIIMFITVDWSLLGKLRAREGGAVKFFQIRQALASARVKLGERRCLETLWRTKGEAG